MLLPKDEIMNALWESDDGYNKEDRKPGDEVHYIDATYNYDSFARRINKLIADRAASLTRYEFDGMGGMGEDEKGDYVKLSDIVEG